MADDGSKDTWRDLFFRSPPKHPDARDVYLFGIGTITAFRGINTLTGPPPTGQLFIALGPTFVAIWGWFWILVGGGAALISATGHRWPEVDRAAGFAVMMIWWMWGLLYLLSAALWTDQFRIFDVLNGCVLILTGVAMSAGVVLGIRKTQEIGLRGIATQRIRELEQVLDELAAENERLRKSVGPPGEERHHG